MIKVEFFSEFDNNGEPVMKSLNVDIDENMPISKLITIIHEESGVPTFVELKWGDNTEKIGCSYGVKESSDLNSLQMITNLDKKISELPKSGTNGELCLYFNLEVGLAN